MASSKAPSIAVHIKLFIESKRVLLDSNSTKAMGKYPPDAPLRLDVAVNEAFPAGGMTVSGRRREAARGRLVIEVIAGKRFTTLAAIDRVREHRVLRMFQNIERSECFTSIRGIPNIRVQSWMAFR
jgi:hypothetical protein